MTSGDAWSARAQAYVESDAHREGEDLDLLVAWATGAVTALDVATGGGHVARRLRDAGLEVVTSDPAPGMRPDVVSHAESLPFADGAFDVRALTDLKRHFLGDHLCDGPKESTPVDSSFRPVIIPADSIDDDVTIKIDSCEFLTADLWGVGQTAPYMHDGRAGTLREAIQEHCTATGRTGQGNASCVSFNESSEPEQEALVAFLMNQVFRPDDPEEPEVE